MRKFLAVALFLCVTLANTGCTIPDVVVSTIISSGNEVASKVAQALTDTAAGAPSGPGETLPAGGGPADTPAAETPAPPTPTATQTLMPTAPLPHLRVVFISGESPWLVAPPAAPYALSASTGVESVDISDDGMMVFYIRRDPTGGAPELRVVNWDGSGDRALLTSAQVGGLEPLGDAEYIDLNVVKWIPGTHQILLNTRAQFMGPGLARSDDLFRIDAESGALTTIFTAGNGGDPWPSPDASKLLISRSTYLSLYNIDGSGGVPNVITFPSIITYSEYSYYPEPVWAADSSQAGVVIASPDPLAAATTGAIWFINGATGTATLQSTLNGNFFFPRGILSPTLDRVSYGRPTPDPAVKDLVVTALDGSMGLTLASGNGALRSFAPDGQHFAYYQGDSGTNVFIGSLGGGTVAVPGGSMRLIWYNAGHFVYASGTAAAWTLKTGDTGGGSTLIASPAGNRTVFDADE
jgi:hypothetical protein